MAWARQSGAKDPFLGFPKENSRLVPVCIGLTSRTWNAERAILLLKASRNSPGHCTFLWQNFSNKPATATVPVGLTEVRTLTDPGTRRLQRLEFRCTCTNIEHVLGSESRRGARP